MQQKLMEASKNACSLLGGKSENYIGIATQFVQEKGWNWWDNPVAPFNVGNIKDVSLNFKKFNTLEEGVNGYAQFLLNDPAGYYTNVIKALRDGTVEEFLTELSKSPYCSPPYPLQELDNIYVTLQKQNNEISNGNLQAQINQLNLQIEDLTKQRDALKKELSNVPSVSTVSKNTVTVQANPPLNTLWGIMVDEKSKGNPLTIADLLRFNPGINPRALQVGQEIRVR